jgi:hypothetical protein
VTPPGWRRIEGISTDKNLVFTWELAQGLEYSLLLMPGLDARTILAEYRFPPDNRVEGPLKKIDEAR